MLASQRSIIFNPYLAGQVRFVFATTHKGNQHFINTCIFTNTVLYITVIYDNIEYFRNAALSMVICASLVAGSSKPKQFDKIKNITLTKDSETLLNLFHR